MVMLMLVSLVVFELAVAEVVFLGAMAVVVPRQMENRLHPLAFGYH
jgi:hypothetical protein